MDSVTQPGPVSHTGKYAKSELEWKDIGSGTFAKTFPQAKRMVTTAKGGPPQCEVYRRIIRSLKTGRVIDDCLVDDVPDSVLHRPLREPEDIRVELIMHGATRMFETKGVDIAEIFSQPRVAQEAALRNYDGVRLTPGWSLDLTRNDPSTEKPWDFTKREARERARQLVRTTEPLLVIGSPPCTMFSPLQNLNKNKWDAEEHKKAMHTAQEHVKFCLEIYRMQAQAGRYFLHEHPNAASSWEMPEVMKLAMQPCVDMAVCDMCAFGLMVRDRNGWALAEKRTRLMSNSPEILKRVNKQCTNRGNTNPHERHRHADTTCGVAKKCQVYPAEFCKAVCAGLAAQKKLRNIGMVAMPLMSVDEMIDAAKGVNEGNPSEALHEQIDYADVEAFDDLTGARLDPDMMRTARKDEIAYFRARQVYEKVATQECWDVTGKAPIATRWVDINKGDEANPNYRSRLVAKEFKTNDRPDLFAATPPSECLRLMISRMASRKGMQMMYADVSRAYFYAKAVRPVYVKLPEEDMEEGDESRCGKLLMSMYGTRDAAMNWSAEYTNTLIADGYVQGKANPCLFRHPQSKVMIMVHGDDFVAVGKGRDLTNARDTLEGKYKIKVEVLGDGEECKQEVRILNKIVRYTDTGIEMEADPRHAEIVVRELGLENAKASKVPGTKPAKTG